MPIRRPNNPPGAKTSEAPFLAGRSREELIAALSSADVTLRLKAVRDIAADGAAECLPALCAALSAETESAVREVIAVELARAGGETVVEGLLPLLRSDEAAVRNIAIDVLKELPRDVAPRMEALLDDPDPDVRIFVVNVLEALRHPAVEDWLIAVISMDGNANVVATALDLLTEVGTAAAVPALRQVMARFPDEPFVIFSAESALRRIGSAA